MFFSLPFPLHFFFGSFLAYLPFVFPPLKFGISFQFVTDFDWVLKAMGKRQAIGSMGGPSRFIKQSDWVGMFQQDTYNY